MEFQEFLGITGLTGQKALTMQNFTGGTARSAIEWYKALKTVYPNASCDGLLLMIEAEKQANAPAAIDPQILDGGHEVPEPKKKKA